MILLVLASLLTQSVVPQDVAIPLDRGWDMNGDVRSESYLGRPALRMRTGRAFRRDVVFEDGTIEFDMAVTPRRSFVYVQFRMQSESEHEEVYFRPHKSELPDAVQYVPVWRGDSQWQFWHGPGATAALAFPRHEWIHVRLEIRGRQAALFVGEGSEPTMLIPLAREPAPGYIALRAFTPADGAPEGEMVAAYSNLVVRPGRTTHAFGPGPASQRLPDGSVTRWRVSPAWAVTDEDVSTVPDSVLATRGNWPVRETDSSGRLLLARYMARPRPTGAAAARLTLRASTETLQLLRLGYSDFATVFVNGRPIFAGNASYSFDNPRQEGLVGLWQATVWLPLRAGDNELLVAVADGFGGWGLMGQLVPQAGVEIIP